MVKYIEVVRPDGKHVTVNELTYDAIYAPRGYQRVDTKSDAPKEQSSDSDRSDRRTARNDKS